MAFSNDDYELDYDTNYHNIENIEILPAFDFTKKSNKRNAFYNDNKIVFRNKNKYDFINNHQNEFGKENYIPIKNIKKDNNKRGNSSNSRIHIFSNNNLHMNLNNNNKIIDKIDNAIFSPNKNKNKGTRYISQTKYSNNNCLKIDSPKLFSHFDDILLSGSININNKRNNNQSNFNNIINNENNQRQKSNNIYQENLIEDNL